MLIHSECDGCGVEVPEDELDTMGYCHDCVCELRSDDPYPDEEDYLIDGVGFANPGGVSALRAETARNPRIHPCPTCRRPNRLTPFDVQRGYQCDACADAAEGGW